MVTDTDTDLQALIKEEHTRAELQRLADGWPGCGCADCQELYKTLDLAKYGNRVKSEVGETIIGEDLKRTSATFSNDHWTDNDMAFVHHGNKYYLAENLRTICAVPVAPTNPNQSPSDKQEGVSKLPDYDITPPKKDSRTKRGVVLKHPSGRPKKKGKVSRITKWRREKDKQGVLL